MINENISNMESIENENQNMDQNINQHTEHTCLPEIQLRPVDSSNWKACVDMYVTSDQEEFVAENWYSLLQWKFSENETMHPFCVYADNNVVGFIMYQLDPETHRWTIMRFMIDAKCQGKGYGRAAIYRLLDMVRESMGNIAFYALVEPGNEMAIKLYESVGFERIGEFLFHDEVLKLML